MHLKVAFLKSCSRWWDLLPDLPGTRLTVECEGGQKGLARQRHQVGHRLLLVKYLLCLLYVRGKDGAVAQKGLDWRRPVQIATSSDRVVDQRWWWWCWWWWWWWWRWCKWQSSGPTQPRVLLFSKYLWGKIPANSFLFWEHFWRHFAFCRKPVSTRGLLFRADEDDWTLASIDV